MTSINPHRPTGHDDGRAKTPHIRLVATRVPEDPTGVALLLHGGAARRRSAHVSSTQLSVLRMIPIARRIAAQQNLAVFRLLNSYRGWHTQHSPADDAYLALEQLRTRFGRPLPITVVGHSLGGRAALTAASHPDVVSVVALNAYLYPTDTRLEFAGRRVLFLHGDRDRLASPAVANTVARAIGRSAEVTFVHVRAGNHSMLARHRVFDHLTAEFVEASQSLALRNERPVPGFHDRSV